MTVADPAAAERAAELAALAARLSRHPLATAVQSAPALRLFMQHHVVCVWDFMLLLKSLQRDFTGAAPLWQPAPDGEAARLVNAIVLDEESDRLPHRGPLRHGSHFEWYLDAMAEVGADAGPMRRALAALSEGEQPRAALLASGLPAAAVAFAGVTLSLLDEPAWGRTAVFHHGREDVIPRLFLPLVHTLRERGLSCAILLGYLERHLDVDEGVHGPAARALLERLYAADPGRRARAERAAISALRARVALWDAIEARCRVGELDLAVGRADGERAV